VKPISSPFSKNDPHEMHPEIQRGSKAEEIAVLAAGPIK
jgi:hypothetical protein